MTTPANPIQTQTLPGVPSVTVNANPPAQPVAPAAPQSQVPDVFGNLVQPAAQPQLSRSTAALGSAQESIEAAQQHADAASKLAITPVITPQTPHARLLAMVSGIALGVSAFGTALGTHGAEGGAKEVAEVQGEQQRQKLAAQQAAQTQRNQQIQNQLTAADTNYKMATAWNLLASAPDEIEQRHLDVEGKRVANIGATQDVRTKALQDLQQTGDVAAYNATLQQLGGSAAPATPGVAPAAGAGVSGTAPTASAVSLPPVVLSNWKNATDAASAAYPNDPDIKAAAAVIANPQSAPQAMAQAARSATSRMNAMDTGAESRKKQADAATAETTAQYAGPKSQADIAKSNAQAAAARGSEAKNAFELGQERREVASIQTPDVTGFVSPLTEKTYDRRYDSFTKSKDYQTLSTLKGSYQQFNDTLNHIAQTGDMTGAESVVGLFNAIGISATPLAGKGFRINSNTINEHVEARGIDQAAYQKLLSLKNGDVITPKQLSDYSNIAAGVYHNAYVNAADEAHRQGLPVDFLPQGGGRPVDPITARIYLDIALHTHPELANNPKAAQAAAIQAAVLNGWSK